MAWGNNLDYVMTEGCNGRTTAWYYQINDHNLQADTPAVVGERKRDRAPGAVWRILRRQGVHTLKTFKITAQTLMLSLLVV